MTYYAVGLGSCGWNDAERKSDYIIAMNAPVMGAQSNGNPMCGRKVEISYNGKTIVGEVRDKCPECQPGDIDVSEGAFVALCGGTGAGRVKIQWKFV
jgi:expansin (peptidoglycan-binding protein)